MDRFPRHAVASGTGDTTTPGAEGPAQRLHRRQERSRWNMGDRLPTDGPNLPRARGGDVSLSERTRRASQDWLKFPVTGVSPDDAVAYASWLDRSGRVPGARLCSEREWEIAARGADAREFPHGDKISSDDANFDLTYGRKNGAFGPDEVGSHPISRSPFSVDDLAGNAWDITTSVLERGQVIVRGGSFYRGRQVRGPRIAIR